MTLLEQECSFDAIDTKFEKLYDAARDQDTEEYRRIDEQLTEIYEEEEFDWPELL